MTSSNQHDAPAPMGRPQWPDWSVQSRVLGDGRQVLLRPVTSGDADLMAEFFAGLAAPDIFYFFALDDFQARNLALNVEEAAAFRLIALGEQEGCSRILGYMFLDWTEEFPPTFGACLRADAQSHGLGWAMIDHLLASGAAAGIDRVRLTVHADNWRALRLYQRVGFRITDDFILQSQGARQYRMEVDLRLRRPPILEDLTVIARGGLGMGLVVGRIQEALEAALGRRPLILDRPVRGDGYAIIVVDLAAPAERPFGTIAPSYAREGMAAGWIASLDTRHLLIGGFGAAAVERAAALYVDLVERWAARRVQADSPVMSARPLDDLPFIDLHSTC